MEFASVLDNESDTWCSVERPRMLSPGDKYTQRHVHNMMVSSWSHC